MNTPGEVMSREQVMLLRGQLSKLTTIAQDHEKEKLKQTVVSLVKGQSS